jgi:hypothetical protein
MFHVAISPFLPNQKPKHSQVELVRCPFAFPQALKIHPITPAGQSAKDTAQFFNFTFRF